MCLKLRFSLLIILFALSANAHKIIAPEPFSIAGKNYLKLQLLADRGDAALDSAFFDVLYNSGLTIKRKTDASLSMIITLNDFNDGVFYVRARVYRQNKCDTLGSKYDLSGVPVILDRQPAFNQTIFQSGHVDGSRQLKNTKLPYSFKCNNNKLAFASFWDADSLYLDFKINDANLNYVKPGTIDLFQARNFLSTLWNSDCIEIGFDMNHDRSEWKRKDDFELLVDVKGGYAGNCWDAANDYFVHWGKNTRISVKQRGTINNNDDVDDGYSISIAIPWTDLHYTPQPGKLIGFDIQLYDKDAALDEAFRSSISGTNPESNDNTSEWTSLEFKKQGTAIAWYLMGILPLAALLVLFIHNKKQNAQTAILIDKAEVAVSPAPYSESIQKAIIFIEENYHRHELSRSQIAEHVFISEKYLSSLFNRETGMHLVAYINNYRVEKAILLLTGTRLSISEIAFKVGYNSLQNFNKNFKVVTKKAPSDYRH